MFNWMKCGNNIHKMNSFTRKGKRQCNRKFELNLYNLTILYDNLTHTTMLRLYMKSNS